jgi:hypothetical protein
MTAIAAKAGAKRSGKSDKSGNVKKERALLIMRAAFLSLTGSIPV